MVSSPSDPLRASSQTQLHLLVLATARRKGKADYCSRQGEAHLFCSFSPPWADLSLLCYDEMDTIVNPVKVNFDLQGEQLHGEWTVNLGVWGA